MSFFHKSILQLQLVTSHTHHAQTHWYVCAHRHRAPCMYTHTDADISAAPFTYAYTHTI